MRSLPNLTKTAVVLVPALALAACNNNDDPDFLRGSEGIPTQSINAYITADVHTHMGTGSTEDETHTTVAAEFYGYDSDDHYFYYIELDEGDTVTATAAGTTTALPALPLPSPSDKLAVVYTDDFSQVAAGELMTVTLDRERDAALQSVDLMLPVASDFSVSPATTDISLNDTLTLEWTATAEYSYRLQFEFICAHADTEDDPSPMRYRVRFPNWRVQDIQSPFSFVPGNFFNPAEPSDLASCTLVSSLFSYPPAQEPDTALRAVQTRTSRQQLTKKNLILN